MPPTFALAASVRPMKTGFISRDYEYHLYKCVCVSNFLMSELMSISLELTCYQKFFKFLFKFIKEILKKLKIFSLLQLYIFNALKHVLVIAVLNI